MRTVDIIRKKRDGGQLTREEIRHLIRGYADGSIPDYQMSAWAMAVFFQGMSPEETAELTAQMVASGDRVDLSPIQGIKVDKHSTGGVGDTVTLVLAPLAASCGVPVAKMSGRGLGHTGGTIDKLESIPGFRVELTRDQFIRQVNEIGVAVMSQSGNLTPADKQLYALRDVTATVESIPLIASSIMSKKIAAGADAIVLDVKTGRGAFMKTLDESIALAETMVRIGCDLGRETVAVISDMDEPLGTAVGNALEVKLAMETLQGRGPADLVELCLELGARMLLLGKRANSPEEAKRMLRESLKNGAALAKFREWVQAQGGNPEIVDRPDLLPTSRNRITVPSPEAGYVSAIRAEQIGLAAMLLGAGRATKDADIDLAVGIRLFRRAGDRVEAGEPIAELHAKSGEDAGRLADIIRMVQEAFTVSEEPVSPRRLLYAIVTRNGVERLG